MARNVLTLERTAPSCGVHRLTGTVSELGVLGAYKVRLFDKFSGRLLREVWSDAEGVFTFDNIANRPEGYFIVGHDHGDDPRNGDMADVGLTLGPMP